MSNPADAIQNAHILLQNVHDGLSILATQSPDGPEPTIATVFPVRTSGGSGLMRPLS